ncbi:unnamed protein product [Nyctereutes procyonoides]|uniref:(raccoon dog) hypothetical protein n=1 Tax=Nyctereutes procyonoides TaxID=34880 RepID=A0A811YEZ7_NYCPR|nr:unnamed protein product [Nyctereutes procyonoides]
MGPAWPCWAGGLTDGRRAGEARDAQTRGRYFCSEPRAAPRPGPLIKPPWSLPPPPNAAGCEAPVPAPPGPPPPPRPSQPAGLRARRPPGAGLGDLEGGSQRLRGRSPTPQRAAHLVTLFKSLTSSGPHFAPYTRVGRHLQAPATRRPGALSSRAPGPSSCSSKDPSRAVGSPARPCPPAPLPPPPYPRPRPRAPQARSHHSAAPGAGDGDASGIPESSKDTSGPVRTAAPWANRFRRSCPPAKGGYRERGREAPPWAWLWPRKATWGGLMGEGGPGKNRWSRRTQSDSESWPISIHRQLLWGGVSCLLGGHNLVTRGTGAT